MNTFTVQRATLATLPDAYALHPDRADAERRLAQFRERMAAGKVSPEQFVLLRSGRGAEAVTLVSDNPHVPLLSRSRADTPHAGLTRFYAFLREAEPGRTLVLDSILNVFDPAPALAAGWRLDDAQVTYETDLTARIWTPAPDAHEGGAELLERSDIAALLAELGQADLELDEGWHLAALLDDEGQPAALGAFGPSGRPDWASINLIGVRGAARRQGLGTRLHAHLLARAAREFGWHVGRTEAENTAMRRIFARSGCEVRGEQLYFRTS